MRATRVPGGRNGFALLVVVFLLFAVGVTAAATYQIVLGEHRLAGFNRDAERARIVAEAGAMRFIGDAVAGPPADAAYFLNGGEAQVSARKVLHDDGAWSELWRVRSVGRVTDPRFFDFPAVREVSRYARMRTPPLERLATLVTTALGVEVGTGFTVSADDVAPAGECVPAGVALGFDVAAAGATVGANGQVYASPQAVVDALGLPPWEVLTDPAYPVDHEVTGGSWPTLDPDEFPVIRVSGTFNALSGRSGQGVLIVTGNVSLRDGFEWDGIILAGGTLTYPGLTVSNMHLRGIVLAGLSSATWPQPPLALNGTLANPSSIRYHSCNVLEAGRGIGVLNPEPSAWWSSF